jgi:hypothetical protein
MGAYPVSPIFFGNGITSAVVGAYRLMSRIWFTVSVSGCSHRVELQIALARVQFFFLRRHLGIESECRESRFEALNLVPKIIRDLVRKGILIGLRHVHDLCEILVDSCGSDFIGHVCSEKCTCFALSISRIENLGHPSSMHPSLLRGMRLHIAIRSVSA